MKKISLIVLFFLASVSVSAYISPFEVSWDKNELRLAPGQSYSADVIVRIPDGHFLYKDKTDISFTALDGIKVDSISYPAAVSKPDPLTGKNIDIYSEGEVFIGVRFSVPKGMVEGERHPEAILELQGCEEKFCLRPERHLLSWNISIAPFKDVVKSGPDAILKKSSFNIKQLVSTRDFSEIMLKGRLFAIAVAFIAGLLTTLTPCVWPLIPVTLLIIGIHKKGHFIGNFLLSVAFAAGISVTYGIFGTVAVAAGSRMSFLFQNKIFVLIVGLFFVAMSLSMFGVFTLSLPNRFQTWLGRREGKGYLGAFISGISVGLLATPCAGPLLIPLLVWVASKQEYLFGAATLSVYAFGLGAVYIVVGTFYGTLSVKLKNIRAGMFVKKLLGALLLIPAIYYLSSLVPYGPDVNGINWKTSEEDAIVESLSTGKPIMMVVGAKWCLPCKELKNEALSDKEVVAALKNVVPLYIDATVETGEVGRLLDKYKVFGWPTILFVGKNGKVYDELTVAGGVPTADEMLRLIKTAVEGR